jgi:chemotaxis protein histidine kinase CheA
MRRISSSLLVLIACSAIAEAAEPAAQNAGRAVRLEEGRQKGLTSQTAATGREVSGLIDEYRFNGLGDEAELKVLDRLQKDLVRLTDANVAHVQAGEDSTTMPWVTTRLNAARQLQNLVELRKELMAASEGQDHVIVQIDKLLKQMQEQFGKQLKTDLTQVIQEQQRLKDATEQLAEKTLGEKAENLSQEQKKDLEKTSDQQEALEEQVKEAIADLQEQAKDQSQPEQAKNAKEALEKLQDPKVQDAIEEAAQDIQDNQLAQAQEAQQQVLDALKQAQQELAQSDAAESQPQEQSAAQLEQQLAAVENIAQQQQQLLDQTKALDQQSSPQEFNKLQAQQASLQNQLAQLQPQGEAAEAAQEAQEAMAEAAQELGQQDQGEAAEAQAEALAALGELKAELAEQLAAATGAPMPGEPKPPMPGQGPDSPMPPQLVVQSQSQVKDPKEPKELGADLQDGDKRDPAGPAAWQVALPPKEREALSAAQKDKFPSRYERQLALYYQNLAAGGK